MGYVDFHTHVLPKVDDGSDSVEKSYNMLKKMADEGTEVVFATPHCLLSREEEKSFIDRRAAAFENLKAYLEEIGDFDIPEIRLGAEIRVNREMKPFENPELLALQGTDMIMFELPYSDFQPAYTENIYNLSLKANLKPVIAHVERYLSIYDDDDYSELFSIPNVICQISADFMENKKTAKFVAGLIEEDFPLVFGSDCHNMTSRPPDMIEIDKKRKKFCSKYKIPEYIMDELFEFQKRLI